MTLLGRDDHHEETGTIFGSQTLTAGPGFHIFFTFPLQTYWVVTVESSGSSWHSDDSKLSHQNC